MDRIRVIVGTRSDRLLHWIERSLAPHPDIQIVGVVHGPHELPQDVGKMDADVLLLDLSDREASWPLPASPRRRGRLRVVALGPGQDEATILGALRMGVQGFVCVRDGRKGLVAAIRAVVAGEAYFCPGACGILIREYLRTAKMTRGGFG